MIRLLAAALALTVAGSWPALRAAGQQLVQRDVYLMGTRALLGTYAANRTEGISTLERAVRVLEDTEAQLSTWRSDSAISRLNQTVPGEPWHASPSLCGLFAQLYEWQKATGAAFDPAVGSLAIAWDVHNGGRVPAEHEFARARATSGLQLLDFDRRACTLVRRAGVMLDVGAFGKGEALDRVARELRGKIWLVDLGGQVAVGGAAPGGQPWIVDIAHPLDRDRPVMQIELSSGSVSTSGGSERDVYLGDVRIGHILDPRTGRPASFSGSVVVWHQQALVADILSTALYVMGPEEGLRWAEARGLTAAYLMAGRTLQVAATTGFRAMKPAFNASARE
jgi:thiamine biosynthesis lipoprotein